MIEKNVNFINFQWKIMALHDFPTQGLLDPGEARAPFCSTATSAGPKSEAPLQQLASPLAGRQYLPMGGAGSVSARNQML